MTTILDDIWREYPTNRLQELKLKAPSHDIAKYQGGDEPWQASVPRYGDDMKQRYAVRRNSPLDYYLEHGRPMCDLWYLLLKKWGICLKSSELVEIEEVAARTRSIEPGKPTEPSIEVASMVRIRNAITEALHNVESKQNE